VPKRVRLKSAEGAPLATARSGNTGTLLLCPVCDVRGPSVRRARPVCDVVCDVRGPSCDVRGPSVTPVCDVLGPSGDVPARLRRLSNAARPPRRELLAPHTLYVDRGISRGSPIPF
jgi:hypothetical protein